MREIRPSGSEGGAGRKPRSYLYHEGGRAGPPGPPTYPPEWAVRMGRR